MKLGRPNLHHFTALKYCWHCQYDLSQSPSESVVFTNDKMGQQWQTWLNQIADPHYHFRQPEIDWLKILHHFVVIATSQRLALNLYAYLCNQIQQQPLNLDRSKRLIWESRSLAERHSTIHACLWLLQDYPNNLIQAWQDKAVRYNHLLKDFRDCPDSFREIVSQMNRNVHKELYMSSNSQ